MSEIGIAKISRPEISTTEIGVAKVGTTEICAIEVGITEVCTAKVRLYLWMLFPPSIPSLCSLPENIEMFLICHNIYFLSNTFYLCFILYCLLLEITQ